ncbi:MAG: SDR family oxidoreductase [Cytophagales bacterium]|jgi:dTDP-4-dehydrorhamnose reductase|nr:SDR family oxidoreductase [Cytophagales bacterium]MCA6368279.1 SDR family oxidoreductase [Cytophagales bacterium]MCA6371095.1 SDR family oxidoreductase [Cytophagales bacterium]MCA6377438.1 SDR family oxidoreductase [Cytophagales bacterium]MCA6382960.1 SDR family oxidoreductase [Cytophagales bacterium]
MRILVTGSNGLLGQKLVELISTRNEHLIATAKSKLVIDLPRGEFHPLDITNRSEVAKVIQEAKPDVVINTAAMTQVDQCETEQDKCWLNNVTAVENLVHACEQTKTHLVQVSTDFIFDGTNGPLDETAKPNPISFYGKSKLAAEVAIQKSNTDWAILRTVLVYGVTNDMSRSNIVLWVKKSLEEGKTINVVNDQWRTPTLAEDLAQGCYLAATKKMKGIYNISGDEMMTPYDIAIKTADFFGLDKSLIKQTDSTQFKQPAARPPKTGFIIDKAKRELGYQPHRFIDGLEVLNAQLSRL